MEEAFLSSFRGLGFSIDRISFVFYLSSIVFALASVFIAYGNYTSEIGITNNAIIIWAYVIEGFLLLLPITLIFYLIGRVIDTKGSRYIFRSFKYGMYIGSSIIFWVLIYSFVAWIIGQIYFGQLLLYTLAAIVIGAFISISTNYLRGKALRKKRVKDKIVVNELGALIGKVYGIDAKRRRIVINTSFGSQIAYSIDRIVDISDKVVIK